MPDILVSRVPPVINLELYAGDGVAIKFTLNDSSNNPYPLDGDVTSQIRVKRSDTTPLLTWTVDSSNQSTGVVVLSLTGAQTESLIAQGKKFVGVWDLQFTPTGAEPMTLVQGKVVCDNDVTK